MFLYFVQTFIHRWPLPSSAQQKQSKIPLQCLSFWAPTSNTTVYCLCWWKLIKCFWSSTLQWPVTFCLNHYSSPVHLREVLVGYHILCSSRFYYPWNFKNFWYAGCFLLTYTGKGSQIQRTQNVTIVSSQRLSESLNNISLRFQKHNISIKHYWRLLHVWVPAAVSVTLSTPPMNSALSHNVSVFLM